MFLLAAVVVVGQLETYSGKIVMVMPLVVTQAVLLAVQMLHPVTTVRLLPHLHLMQLPTHSVIFATTKNASVVTAMLQMNVQVLCVTLRSQMRLQDTRVPVKMHLAA
jgi:hypothetical protein